MRKLYALFVITLVCATLSAQRPTPGRTTRAAFRAENAEALVRQAAQSLSEERKVLERDIKVLGHLRAADDALVDDMQRAAAIQRAYENVEAARALEPGFLVMQGVIRSKTDIEAARRSPASADFGRLRSVLREEALRPASRVAIRNALRLEEETLAWIKVQELLAVHLRALAELSGDSLRAAQQ